MKSYLFLAIALLALGLAACENPVAVLEKEVIGYHDVVMPQTLEVQKMHKQISRLADSLLAAPAPDSLRAASAQALLTELKAAETGMMNWMKDYNRPEGKAQEEALAYLNSEKDKILKIKQMTEESLANARAFLGQ
jgi:hypothetical protein